MQASTFHMHRRMRHPVPINSHAVLRWFCANNNVPISVHYHSDNKRHTSGVSSKFLHFHIWHFDYDMRSHYVMTFSYFHILRKVFHLWHLIARCMWRPTQISSRAASDIWQFHILTFDVKYFTFDIWYFHIWHLTFGIFTFSHSTFWQRYRIDRTTQWHFNILIFDVKCFTFYDTRRI